jgi:oligopeptide/dipeptide ABC transporter ATP-binding protein
MNLLIDLREKLGLTYIFISHDLAMIRYISDFVAVMYLGKIVEFGNWEQVINDPKHPYTQALIHAMPDHTVIGNPESLAKTLQGEVPDPVNLPTGCAFHLRCVKATPACASALQTLIEISPNHQVACMEAKA